MLKSRKAMTSFDKQLRVTRWMIKSDNTCDGAIIIGVWNISTEHRWRNVTLITMNVHAVGIIEYMCYTWDTGKLYLSRYGDKIQLETNSMAKRMGFN